MDEQRRERERMMDASESEENTEHEVVEWPAVSTMIPSGFLVWAVVTGEKEHDSGRRIRGTVQARYEERREYTIYFHDEHTGQERWQENTPEALVQQQKRGEDGDDERWVRTSLDRFAQEDSEKLSAAARTAIDMEKKEINYFLIQRNNDKED